MANSQIISEIKNKVLSLFQNDERIVKALNIRQDEDEENLTYVRLFPYKFIPDTQEEVKTYILVEVDIMTERNRYDAGTKRFYWDYPTITIDILSHQKDMVMNELGISKVRTDYLSELIDELLNGYSGLGFARLQRLSNISYSLNDTYRYREIKFTAVDLNDSMCEE